MRRFRRDRAIGWRPAGPRGALILVCHGQAVRSAGIYRAGSREAPGQDRRASVCHLDRRIELPGVESSRRYRPTRMTTLRYRVSAGSPPSVTSSTTCTVFPAASAGTLSAVVSAVASGSGTPRA